MRAISSCTLFAGTSLLTSSTFTIARREIGVKSACGS
jgi:hypothetical protein